MSRMMRLLAVALAYLFLAFALIGVLLPGLPTVPFLLLSAWFASRGSERLRQRIYDHPYLGKLLTDWEEYGAISRMSKIMAVLMLSVSWVIMFYRIDNLYLMSGISVFFIGMVVYLVSRPEPQ